MITDQQSSMQPSTQRPIPLSMRPDLVIKRIDYLGVGYWVVKDPAGLKYYRLQQEQHEVLKLLDGRRSLEHVRDAMLEKMPTVRLQLSDIQHLITDLHEKGLVYSNREGQGAALIKKHNEERKKKFFNTLRSLLYVRLPGWDPESVLTVMYPFLRWMFTPFGVGLFATAVLSAWGLLAVQFDTFRQELPEFQQFFGWPNLIYMWAVLGICKIIHEFGHGLSCKHFGGECHEMGVMLLVFSPCLYCDVSDSWMLRNKWARIMIGAAGMYIEVLLSAFAIFVWWYTADGMLHMLALNTFFVTTITTVIFNANPLMRFDGYYMMSDFLEIPNLRPKADRLLREWFSWYCLGIESKPDPFMPETGRAWFVTFAIAAAIYRWFIVIAITLFLYTVLKPYGLQSIGITLAFISVSTIVGNMVFNVYKVISTPRIEPMSKPKICLTLTVVASAIAAALAIPMPLHIEATFIIEPVDVQHIVATTPGELVEFNVGPGKWIQEGDLIAELSNPEKHDELRDLELKRDLQEIRRETQLQLGNTSQMVVADEQKTALTLQIDEVKRQLEDLKITAPISGRIIEPPRTAAPDLETTRQQLSGWIGTPLEKKNIGAVLEERTHLVSIAPSSDYQAIMLIDQGDRNELIHREDLEDIAQRLVDSESQTIELRFDHLPSRSYEGTVEHVSKNPMDYVPELLSNKLGGELATVTDGQGRERLQSPVYQATVTLSEDTSLLRTGMRGKARFLVEERTLGEWLSRYFWRTVRFRL